MRTIAFSLQKGGSGKTSISVSVAAELARQGDTLLVDADPQGNATAWIGPGEVSAELAGVLFEEYKAQAAIVKTATPGLWLLPSAGQGGNLKKFIERGAADNPFCMQQLADEAAGLGFRYMVVDLSPAFGTFERTAVTAADEVVTPVLPEQFCLDGLQIFAENLTDARKRLRSDKPVYNKLVVTALNKSFKRHAGIFNSIRKANAGMNVYVIPQDQIFGNVQVLRQTVQATGAAKPETLEAIEILARDLSAQIGAA
jgi:chromosome partitioning protein